MTTSELSDDATSSQTLPSFAAIATGATTKPKLTAPHELSLSTHNVGLGVANNAGNQFINSILPSPGLFGPPSALFPPSAMGQGLAAPIEGNGVGNGSSMMTMMMNNHQNGQLLMLPSPVPGGPGNPGTPQYNGTSELTPMFAHLNAGAFGIPSPLSLGAGAAGSHTMSAQQQQHHLASPYYTYMSPLHAPHLQQQQQAQQNENGDASAPSTRRSANKKTSASDSARESLKTAPKKTKLAKRNKKTESSDAEDQSATDNDEVDNENENNEHDLAESINGPLSATSSSGAHSASAMVQVQPSIAEQRRARRRARNRVYARSSRERKKVAIAETAEGYKQALSELAQLRAEVQHWKMLAMQSGAVPHFSNTGDSSIGLSKPGVML